MSYLDVKNQFTALLNRRDLTSTLTTTFLNYGIQRIQRNVRVPAMERVVEMTTGGTALLVIPSDLLEFIDVYSDDDNNGRNRLVRTDTANILKWSAIAGQPMFFKREAQNIRIGPYPPSGQSLYIHYYADASNLTADADENWMTEIAPMLLVYAALSYAADYYSDDRLKLFEDRYTQIENELLEMANVDELTSASIQPAYPIEDY